MMLSDNRRRMWLNVFLAGLLVAWGLTVGAVPGPSQTAGPPTPTAPSTDVAAADAREEAVRLIARHSGPCTVGIYCQKDGYSSFFGTGTVITPDGYVLTSTTVVPQGANEIEVIFPDFVRRMGKIVEVSDALETSLIKVEAEKLPFLALARELPAIGTSAYTMSNANNVLRLNGQPSFSHGVISGVYEVADIGGESLYAGIAIETTAAVNPGSDGGPIINAAGQLCAVISLNVSPLRWQGVGVPTKVLLERLEAFKSGQVKPSADALAGLPAPALEPDPTTPRAEEIAKSLVGVTVRRKYPVELLPRIPWDQFQKKIPDWDKMEVGEKTSRLGAYFETVRLLEVNQMLRRPAGAATGILISADGYVLTSQFNVGDDTVYLVKESGIVRQFDMTERLEKLVKPPDGGYTRETNPVEQITVTLPDGSQREAQLVARHIPLGIALLKVEGQQLPFLDLAAKAASPDLGGFVGLVGVVAGGSNRYTLNTGIVSAPSRNRGFIFQTDAMVNYGNSGGPVIDREGRLLGVAAAPLDPQTVMGRLFVGDELNSWSMAPNSGVGLIARADRIRDALEELKSGKSILQIPGPYLGVTPDPNKVFSEEVILGAVTPKSPADAAGLKKGDRLLTLNGEDLRNWRDLTDHLTAFKPGDKVEIKVFRPRVSQRLMVNGKELVTEEDLRKLKENLKPGDKFEGTFVVEDTRVFTVILGERQ